MVAIAAGDSISLFLNVKINIKRWFWSNKMLMRVFDTAMMTQRNGGCGAKCCFPSKRDRREPYKHSTNCFYIFFFLISRRYRCEELEKVHLWHCVRMWFGAGTSGGYWSTDAQRIAVCIFLETSTHQTQKYHSRISTIYASVIRDLDYRGRYNRCCFIKMIIHVPTLSDSSSTNNASVHCLTFKIVCLYLSKKYTVSYHETMCFRVLFQIQCLRLCTFSSRVV